MISKRYGKEVKEDGGEFMPHTSIPTLIVSLKLVPD
jgi:hypothetical protein